MYGFDYEEDILGVLRLLKYLSIKEPEHERRIRNYYDAFNEDDVFQLAQEAIWAIYDEAFFTEDEESQMAVVMVRHKEFDRFLALGREWQTLNGAGNSAAYGRKLQDAFCFFVAGMTHSVFDVAFHCQSAIPVIEVWLSPDCFEEVPFANGMLDLLIYIEQENKHLEQLIAEKKKEVLSDEAQDRKEAA